MPQEELSTQTLSLGRVDDPEQELSKKDEEPSNEFTPLYDLDTGAKEAALSQQKERLKASLKYMEELYPTMIESYKKYRSIADPIKDALGNIVENEPNIFIPYPYGIVESELPRLAGKLPRIRIAPRKEIDDEQVERRQDYLYYVFDRMNFLQKQTLWLRQYSIYGWSPLYYYWRTEEANMLTIKPGKAGGKPKLVKEKVKRYDDFWCKVLDVFDCFLQPGVTSPEDGDWFIFRELVSKEDLKKLVEAGIFYPEVSDFVRDNLTVDTHSDTGRDSRDDLAGQLKDSSPHSYGKYELYWCLEDERIVCTLGTTLLCMVSDNPNPLQKKPILNCNLTEQMSEPIGVSTIEALGGLPDKLNALSNARLKDISLRLGKVFLGNRQAQADWDNFVMESGNIIFTNDIENTVKELEFGETGLDSEREVLTSKEEMQFAVGVSDYIVGVKSGARLTDTATGVSTIVREANARYGLKQASYESGCLRDLVIAADAYAKLYCTEEKQIYVLGPTGFKSTVITPENLAWEADIMVEPGSVVPLDQASRSEKLTTLLDRVIGMPNVVKIDKYMQQVLEAADIRNADELIIPQAKNGALASDMQLAEQENISLGMGQAVVLTGDDNLHLSVHGQMDTSMLSPQIMKVVQDHIQEHTKKLEALQQQQIAAAMAAGGGLNVPTNQNPQVGAALPNQPGAGPQAGGAGAPSAMAGIAGMAGSGGGSPSPKA